MSARLPLAAALVLLAAALPHHPVDAAPAGTLDQLVAELEGKLDRAWQGSELRRCDLALALRAGPGVDERLRGVVRGLLQGRLATKGLRSSSELAPPSRRAGAAASTPGAPPPRSLAARARAAGYELLLELELVVVEGHLHLRGQLTRTDRSLWRDLRQPDRGALSHLHASVRVDAEVRSYQGSIASAALRFSQQTLPIGRGEILALGAGDVDGDGRTELVVLYPLAVDVLRHRGAAGGFALAYRAKLAGAAATLRPRRPLGALVVVDLDRDRRAEVLARSSELERGALLAFDGKALVLQRELAGYPLIAAPGELVLGAALPGQDLFAAAATVFTPATPLPVWQKQLPANFYMLKAVTLSHRRGPRRFVGVVDGAGQLSLAPPDGEPLSGPRVGTAFALVDLDDDGTLELVHAGAEGPDADDQLVVLRLTPGGLRPLWRGPSVGGQVVDVTAGDFDGDGKLEVVAAIRQRGGQSSLLVLH